MLYAARMLRQVNVKDFARAGLRPPLGPVRRRARNAAIAAAIAANPDMPVPTAAMSVHPDPPPELPATAITVVTVPVAGVGPFFAAGAAATPLEGDGGAVVVAERGPVCAVTVTVTVTGADVTSPCGLKADADGAPSAGGAPSGVGVGAAVSGAVSGGGWCDAPGEVAR